MAADMTDTETVDTHTHTLLITLINAKLHTYFLFTVMRKVIYY
jgi:hypothetical protein